MNVTVKSETKEGLFLYIVDIIHQKNSIKFLAYKIGHGTKLKLTSSMVRTSPLRC